uniref:ZZ-type domain-containing protein n=1 Tax=Arcella intermedia TaxID=1963864 RepID=A0A6B2LLQ8_9EUKA
MDCGGVNCSRYVAGHAALHNETTHHPVAVSFSDLSVWCYNCNSYIQSRALMPLLGTLHRAKFGHLVPGESYFVCNACRARIRNGVRWHCKDCKDYDLCSDCKDANKTSDSHEATHAFTCNVDHERSPY